MSTTFFSNFWLWEDRRCAWLKRTRKQPRQATREQAQTDLEIMGLICCNRDRRAPRDDLALFGMMSDTSVPRDPWDELERFALRLL
ncbi:MAG TPA: hypothetical protein VHD36_04465 [Pirellulales bacterium]|nr:hypothetical protein [Pirellulales bacterium]